MIYLLATFSAGEVQEHNLISSPSPQHNDREEQKKTESSHKANGFPCLQQENTCLQERQMHTNTVNEDRDVIPALCPITFT